MRRCFFVHGMERKRTDTIKESGGKTKMKVGMLTSGGDCQGLNPAMRGVAKALYEQDPSTQIYGIRDGYRGLMEGKYRLMEPRNFSGILRQGGTILGTSRQPYKSIVASMGAENGQDKVAAMVNTYQAMQLDALVILGGNGTHKTANLLREQGLNIVTLPKTIDNDLWGTDMTFGFQSAVDIATDTIDRIHTTATSHSRVFIIEVMGHKVGHVTLHAGIAGGADIILIPEIPYDIKSIVKVIEGRSKAGKPFTILAVAEGAISKEDAKLKKKEYKEKLAKRKYPSIAYELAEQIQKETDKEVRITVPGHTQRGGSPCPYDRVIATRVGAKAAELILEGKFGYMIAIKKDETTAVPLEEVAGKLKTVDPKCGLIKEARMVGISFGDE